jgi:hypothetical protein
LEYPYCKHGLVLNLTIQLLICQLIEANFKYIRSDHHDGNPQKAEVTILVRFEESNMTI